MKSWLKTNRRRLAAAVLLAAAAVLFFQWMWLDPNTHNDSISVTVMETSGLKPSEGRSEILLPEDLRYAQLLALVNSQPYRRHLDQSIRGVQVGGGKQNAGPWPGGRSGAELFSEAMEILRK